MAATVPWAAWKYPATGCPERISALNGIHSPNPVQGVAMELIRIIISVLIPPIGAFLKVGLGLQFWVNLLLTILGYFPGLVHVIWLLTRKK
jgi:uncharacterized membrane protein YqaE (UPF0057 family)